MKMTCIKTLISLVLWIGLGLFNTTLAASQLSLQKSVEIVLAENTVIKEQSYHLGDIAEIHGTDPLLLEKLSKVSIGRSPLPGGSVVVTKTLILSRLKPFLKANEEVSFVGPFRATVERAALRISGDDVNQLVLDYIASQYDGQDIQPKLVSSAKDLLLPKGALSYEIQEKGKHRKEAGYRTYEVSFSIDEKVQKRVQVRAYLKVYKDIYIAKETIKGKHVIEEADLKRVRRNIDRVPLNYITDKQSVIGKVAKRAINPNEVIKASALLEPPVVRSGDRLLILFESDSLKLTAPGVAMANGTIGEQIQVQNLVSQSVVYATVQDSKMVQVN